jgi:hypothetical protein
MKLSDLLSLARLVVPGAQERQIPDSVLTTIFNAGANDLAFRLRIYPKNIKFDVEASKQEYQLSAIDANFLTPDKSGIWFYDGSGWRKVLPSTTTELDNKYPNWRDAAASDNPLLYYIDGDYVGFYPQMSTARTNGLWLYYLASPTPMASGTHYPFPLVNDQTKELPRTAILWECLMKYYEWKALPVLSKPETTEVRTAEDEYLRSVEMKRSMFEQRLDISASKESVMQPKAIGGFVSK